MATDGTWNVFELERAPKLFLKCQFSHAGYSIHITDLSKIWGESLSKADVVQRALDSGSSIDPSQDDEQFHLLLGKIQSAFDREQGTSFELHTDDADEDSLAVDISVPLPKPLPALRWTVNLRLLAPQQLEAQIITPLLSQAGHLQHQIEQLVHELQAKDRVISKICDRLETSGNDLTTVFPNVSGIKTTRKKSQREQLAKHIKGLTDFDEDAWRVQNAETTKQDGLTDEEMNGVLHQLPVSVSQSSLVNDRAQKEWWKHLKLGTIVSSQHESSKSKSPTPQALKDEDEDMQDSMFQRQATPPGLRQDHSADGISHNTNVESHEDRVPDSMLQNQVDDGSTTEEEDDLDAGPKQAVPSRAKRSATPQQAVKMPSPKPVAKKLGGLGGHKRQDSPPAQTSSRELGGVDERSPEPPSSTTRREPMPELQPSDSKPQPKLGKIGGKAKAPTPSATESETSAHGFPPPAKGPARAHKIGKIGGKHKASSTNGAGSEKATKAEPDEEKEPTRARAPTKEPTPPPRETSQERANKKRDELKRALEEKAKAPVKKKRKF